MIACAKNAAGPAGHCSRPDVTQLLFDRKPKRAVIGESQHGTEIEFPDLEPTEPATAGYSTASHQPWPKVLNPWAVTSAATAGAMSPRRRRRTLALPTLPDLSTRLTSSGAIDLATWAAWA